MDEISVSSFQKEGACLVGDIMKKRDPYSVIVYYRQPSCLPLLLFGYKHFLKVQIKEYEKERRRWIIKVGIKTLSYPFLLDCNVKLYELYEGALTISKKQICYQVQSYELILFSP